MSIETTGVLVGTDRSGGAEAALAWAAAEAVARRVPLTVAAVADLTGLADLPCTRTLLETAQRTAEETVAAAVARVRDLVGALPVTGRALAGDPAGELLRLAAGADEVVVGSHGTSTFPGLLLGSVGHRVAEHAAVPAVVVRGGRSGGRVLVGVDTSPHGEAALEYAFAYADRHHLPLEALHAYTLGAVVYPVLPYGIAEELAAVRAGQEEAAREAVGRWTEKYPDVPVRVTVAEGPAAYQLAEASRTAGLLVVGTRGHGALIGTLLGSVSQSLLRHAHCPVAIAR